MNYKATKLDTVIKPMAHQLTEWLRTARLQTAMVTSFALWLGYITTSEPNIQGIAGLGLVGIFLHAWGFILNEVEDYEYDKRNGDISGHPIAKGRVDVGTARKVSWASLIVAGAIMLLISSSIVAVSILALSVIPGYLYNKYSKQHWWSNIYLSGWVSVVVMSGGAFNGMPNNLTMLLASILAIQIFVQVIEGDLKDIKGDESTFSEKCGVQLKNITVRGVSKHGMPILEADGGPDDKRGVTILSYTNKFVAIVYGLKFAELTMIIYVLHHYANFWNSASGIEIGTFIGMSVLYIVSISMFLVEYFDREEIKQMSSVHELSSIILISMVMLTINVQLFLLVALTPIIWYVVTNNLLYSSSLSPDI